MWRIRIASWINKATRAKAHARARALTPTPTHTHILSVNVVCILRVSFFLLAY